MDVTRILPGVAESTAPGRPGSPVGGGHGGASFGDVLKDSIAQVNQLQHEADAAIKDLAVGGPTSLHDTMIALEKAESSFKLMMQVRNKIVDAYHEILRMQV